MWRMYVLRRRDPRTRRLAEQQAARASSAVPEQLSFKEKMKMFALESGEHSTPKDKVRPHTALIEHNRFHIFQIFHYVMVFY